MPRNILIVDDSRFSRLSLRAIIAEKMPDAYVCEAANGAEAMAVVEEMMLDFVFLDYNMPGDDGLTVGRAIRARQPEARLAMVTANVQGALAEEVRAAGIDFIGKPIKAAAIADFLGREQA
ncbi:response regulator transcription factor [Magnetospirillum aberrantis]|uniref:Response regulator n=1 Tax=Magnetospirillum aberrantis SpK TaxID=908842 RepID=A0A7C9UUH8_9PROT|nr:response regulator [Magnetospirillum aberrantis]NFV80728.1 response regulator [Magnetospirillum aberrantis SpK]